MLFPFLLLCAALALVVVAASITEKIMDHIPVIRKFIEED